MKSRHCILLVPLLALLAILPAQAAKPASDILPPEVRRAAVERADRLAHPPELAPLPADLVVPFHPPGFDRPDGSAAAAAAADARPGDAKGGAKGQAAPAPQTDRDLLANVAAKIPTTGTIIMGDKPLLISGRNRIEVGSHFTVVLNGQEYELELIAIDRTTFTVRYKGEEFTRPIKQGKSP